MIENSNIALPFHFQQKNMNVTHLFPWTRLAAVVLLLATFTAPQLVQAQSELELQAMYKNHLTDDMGLEAFVDSDGDVQFSYQDRNYFIEVAENDLEFFRVVLFNIWAIESEEEFDQVEKAVAAVNADLKVVKAYIYNDNVWIATELFLPKPSDFSVVLPRCLEVIDSGVDKFVEKMGY